MYVHFFNLQVGKSHSALYHSACIWGVDMITTGPLGTGAFISCSSDDTVRLWSPRTHQSGGTAPNIYSNVSMKIFCLMPIHAEQ